MSGTLRSLDIARKALWASQLGMDVTSNNIANVNTLGYSRQRVNTSPAMSLDLQQGQLGLGVNVDSITRIKNNLLDQQYRDNQDRLGYANTKESIYTQIETILQDPGENSIGSLMNDFFLEFSSLASDPENMTTRLNVRQKAKTLVEGFHSKNNQLQLLKSSVKNETESALKSINGITKQIAELNGQISRAEVGKSGANNLRDRRDVLLDKLSEYLKINVTETKQGEVIVSAEGMNLVSHKTSFNLSLESNSGSVAPEIKITNTAGKKNTFKYGKLGSLLEMYNQQLPKFKAKLDSLAFKIADHVNNLHRAGQTLPEGNPPSTQQGISFFVGTTAEDLNLSDKILEDVGNIAASTSGEPGDGDTALAIANLKENRIMNGGNESLNDFYTGVVKEVSFNIEKAGNSVTNQELLINQIENQRQTESGVSLDEEMTNLMKYQRSYQAAAKVIRAADQILETIINLT